MNATSPFQENYLNKFRNNEGSFDHHFLENPTCRVAAGTAAVSIASGVGGGIAAACSGAGMIPRAYPKR